MNTKIRVKRILTRIFKPLAGIVIVLITVFPIYWLVAMSVRPMSEMTGHISLFPHSFTFEHFAELFVEKGFGTALLNSIEVTLISLAVSLVFGLCASYVLTRNRFKVAIKKPLNTWILIVRILPPIAFTIPLYIMFNKLGIMNTKIPIIMACILINIPFIIWFMVGFFRNLPEDMEKSARVDGANEWQLFTKIVLPLVLPGIAAVAMLSFMYAWNEYTYSIIFVQSPSTYTIPLKLALLNSDDTLTNFGLVAAGGVVSAIPMLLFIIFAQNYLITGLSSGAVKE